MWQQLLCSYSTIFGSLLISVESSVFAKYNVNNKGLIESPCGMPFVVMNFPNYYCIIIRKLLKINHEVLWWALRHVGVEKWLVNVIKSMYDGVTTAVKRNGEESESFEIKVGVHQGSVCSQSCLTL